jgi:N-acetyl-gamma-glutamyl-phosphate reductase
MKARAGVAGHRGYSGAELLRLLSHHSSVEAVLLDHREPDVEGPRIRKAIPPARISATADAVREAGLDVIFLATPPEVSMDLAPGLLAAGTRVIDLSGAFRLQTPERYERWYRQPHTQAALLARAVYGLPELYRAIIPSACLVANPGCYPTAASVAIRPLVCGNVADLQSGIVCDAKSGVSGAGRKPSMKTSFCEVTENFSAYSILKHRHVPEVLQNTGLEEAQFSFTAQLIPIERGIFETIYFRAGSEGLSTDSILRIYENAYGAEPFIRIHEAGSMPDLRGVARTNFCDIGVHFDALTGRGVVVTAIDNLVKGAAGQAIQNMNLMLGFPETEGLL